ncbi:DNA repair exonuclease [Fructobacillus sp. M2-14]|uniref:DNA repair exonuclease n=1 Tax=Fructobacillus broussonetiae TaxID=2713173 RepID=A0ABS5QYM0_9LACO|nr:DNA repair exonuclease [Fructobacillus broussonetiae]MBS9338298.1 DNA repair exonuclease [Fructobacillus broussonetiae]
MVSFLHAGDVHLGNPFSGLSRQLNQEFEKDVLNATFDAFQTLINTAIKKQVDFVLFPGDLLHGSGNSAKIQATLSQGFFDLDQNGIQVVLSYGNHDYQALNERGQSWPKSVHVFGNEVETVTLSTRRGEKVAFSGFSYQDRMEKTDRLSTFPMRASNVDYHIGLYHGSVGQAGRDQYAAFSIQDMVQKGYDYWALGHIHQREILNEKPFIAYSGNLQGLNRKETGEKGCYLVQSSDQGELTPTFIPCAKVLWEQVEYQNLSSFDALVSKLTSMEVEKPTLLSVELSGEVGNDLLAAEASGQLLEQVQSLHFHEQIWPVNVSVKRMHSAQKPAFASMSFDEAIESVLETDGEVANLLTDVVPLEVRQYFNSKEGEQAVQERLNTLMEGGDDREN